MAELLLELLSEEIPARMQPRAAEDLRRLVVDRLAAAQLAHDDIRAFVTSRRLALVVAGLPQAQPDVAEERRGPRVGAPEAAVQGFLKSSGIASLAECEARDTGRFDDPLVGRLDPGPSGPASRGLYLVNAISDLVRTHTTASGTTIQAYLRFDPSAGPIG